MTFFISMKIDRSVYRLKVTRVLAGPSIEHYEVQARNKRLLFETNRPVMLRHGLKHKPFSWKLIEGSIKFQNVIDEITGELESYLRQL